MHLTLNAQPIFEHQFHNNNQMCTFRYFCPSFCTANTSTKCIFQQENPEERIVCIFNIQSWFELIRYSSFNDKCVHCQSMQWHFRAPSLLPLCFHEIIHYSKVATEQKPHLSLTLLFAFWVNVHTHNYTRNIKQQQCIKLITASRSVESYFGLVDFIQKRCFLGENFWKIQNSSKIFILTWFVALALRCHGFYWLCNASAIFPRCHKFRQTFDHFDLMFFPDRVIYTCKMVDLLKNFFALLHIDIETNKYASNALQIKFISGMNGNQVIIREASETSMMRRAPKALFVKIYCFAKFEESNHWAYID